MNPRFPPRRRRAARAAFCLAALLAAGCAGLGGAMLGVPEVSPAELNARRGDDPPPIVLDVRDARSFDDGRIDGAVRVPASDAGAYLERHGVPRTRAVVAVCARGRASLVAAAFARGHGYERAASLAGGMEAWERSGFPVVSGPAASRGGERTPPPILPISRASQVAMTAGAVAVKPLYVLLSLLLVVVLWRATSDGLVLIRRAVVLFFLGENACTINFAVAQGVSAPLDLLHGLGMAGMNALLPWGFLLLFDEHVVHYLAPDAACAFQRLCRTCWKRDDVGCRFHRLATCLAPALAAVALAPLTAPLPLSRVVLPVLGSDVPWPREFAPLFAEFRVYPVVAAALFLVAFGWLLRGRAGQRAAMASFFAASGMATYSLFRVGLTLVFRGNPAWDDWWEEFTELIALAALTLFLIEFRGPLGLRFPFLRPGVERSRRP